MAVVDDALRELIEASRGLAPLLVRSDEVSAARRVPIFRGGLALQLEEDRQRDAAMERFRAAVGKVEGEGQSTSRRPVGRRQD